MELQNVVLMEGVCLTLILSIIIASIKRWKSLLYIASTAATAAFFIAWSPVMAAGSMLVYGPASILMWMELAKESAEKMERRKKIIRNTCWSFLVAGVSVLILKNIYNIYNYLT